MIRIGNGRGLTLHQLALARGREPVASEQQHRTLRALVQHHGCLGLGQRSDTTQSSISLFLAHTTELVQELLHPRVHRLYLGPSLGQPVSDNRLIHQRFTECLPLECVLESGRQGHARLPGHADGDDKPLMVKVGHDDPHALAFAADQVRHGDRHIVQLDVRCATGLLTGDVQPTHRDTRMAFERHHYDRQTRSSGPAGADGHGGVVTPDAVGDPKSSAHPVFSKHIVSHGFRRCIPFLRPIDDIMRALLVLGGCRGDMGHIAARFRLRDGNASALLAGQEVREKPFLQFLAAVFDDRGDAKRESGVQ